MYFVDQLLFGSYVFMTFHFGFRFSLISVQTSFHDISFRISVFTDCSPDVFSWHFISYFGFHWFQSRRLFMTFRISVFIDFSPDVYLWHFVFRFSLISVQTSVPKAITASDVRHATTEFAPTAKELVLEELVGDCRKCQTLFQIILVGKIVGRDLGLKMSCRNNALAFWKYCNNLD